MQKKLEHTFFVTIVAALLHFAEQWFFGFEEAFTEVVSQVNLIGQFFDPW